MNEINNNFIIPLKLEEVKEMYRLINNDLKTN